MSGNNWKLWLGAAALGITAQAAQAGVLWSGNGHEYQVVTSEGITWSNAKAAADLIGWHLATVTSAAEDAFVSSLLPASPASRSHYWLGASDAVQEGTWQWVTGEPWSYTHWGSGEPNNDGGVENYLAYDYRSGWAWNDAPDDMSRYGFVRGYVIERPRQATVPLPATLPLLGIGIAAVGVASRRKHSR